MEEEIKKRNEKERKYGLERVSETALTCEWRVNVDEINFSTVLLKQMAHNLKIISPENLVNPSVFFCAIGFT